MGRACKSIGGKEVFEIECRLRLLQVEFDFFELDLLSQILKRLSSKEQR